MERTVLLAAITLYSAVLAPAAVAQDGSTNESSDGPGAHHRVAAVRSLSSSEVQVERHGDRIWVHAESEVDADRTTIWSTLSDYDHLAQFIPDMSSSRTISRNGSEVVVEQKGSAGFGPIRQRFSVLLAVREALPESISLSGVSGDFKYFDARYDIVPLAPHRSRIVYEATMIPGTSVPSVVGLPVMRSLINAQFGALVQEVLRRAA
jgi:ribosome-associated toxin RatA of RatAB toxin-antitoxin module